jgi:hypothetical protein
MLLSMPRLTDHSQYKDWTIEKGRLSTFQSIRLLFAQIYQNSDTTEEKRRAPPGRLTKLLKDGVFF